MKVHCTTIKKRKYNIEVETYRTTSKFQRDVMLIFSCL